MVVNHQMRQALYAILMPQILLRLKGLNLIKSINLKRDPGLHISINTYPIDKWEDVQMAYINMISFQPDLQKYPLTKHGKQNRQLQFSWFSKFSWLEYFILKDKAFCFPCFFL